MKLAVEWITVCGAMAVVDYCWTKYMLSVSKQRRIAASAWSAAIVGLGAYATMKYIESPVLLSAAVVGAFFGTLVAMDLERKP